MKGFTDGFEAPFLRRVGAFFFSSPYKVRAMIPSVKVSTVGEPLTRDVEALGEGALDALDQRWSGAVTRLWFTGWMREHLNNLVEQRKRDWTKIFQLYKPQCIEVGNHQYNAYRFVLMAVPPMDIHKPEDFDTPGNQALLNQSRMFTCFLVLDQAAEKIISLINPLL